MIEIGASIAQEAGRWHVLQATRKVMENLGVSSAINFEVAGLDYGNDLVRREAKPILAASRKAKGGLNPFLV
jgi:hypothetical protein